MIAVMIEREFGVTYNPRSVCRLLHQIGITYQRGKLCSQTNGTMASTSCKRKKWEKETWPSILKRARKLKAGDPVW